MLDNVWDWNAVEAFRFNDSWATIIVTARESKVLPKHERESRFHWVLGSEVNSSSEDCQAAPDFQLLKAIVKGADGSFNQEEEV